MNKDIWIPAVIGGYVFYALSLLLFLAWKGLQAAGWLGKIHFRFIPFEGSYGGERSRLLQKEFEALGFVVQDLFLERSFWGGSVRSLALASEAEHTFASIYDRGSQVYYYLYTPFSSAGVLLTASRGFPAIEAHDCLVQSVPTLGPKELLGVHRERQQKFIASGFVPGATSTRADRLQASDAFYANPTFRRWARQSVIKAGTRLAALILIPALLLGGYLAATEGWFLRPASRLGWETRTSLAGAFSVAMPAEPVEKTDGMIHTFTSYDLYYAYYAVYADYLPGVLQEYEPAKIFEILQDELIPEKGTLVFEKDFTFQGYPAHEFRARESDDLMTRLIEGRLYIVENRIYEVYVKYLPPATLGEEIQVYLDSFKLLDEKALDKLRRVTPQGKMPAFDLKFVRLHDCGGEAEVPYAAFKVTNKGEVVFRKLTSLIQDEQKEWVLYGKTMNNGLSSLGFHTNSEDCGVGVKNELSPGESAYISLALSTRECLPACRAHAVIKLCGDTSNAATCAERSVEFNVP